jgi:hypothetical protein
MKISHKDKGEPRGTGERTLTIPPLPGHCINPLPAFFHFRRETMEQYDTKHLLFGRLAFSKRTIVLWDEIKL